MLNKKSLLPLALAFTVIGCAPSRVVNQLKPPQRLINPKTTTETTYEGVNWSYALFNQYASGLSYTLRLNYSVYNATQVQTAISVTIGGNSYGFSSWSTITSTYAEAVLDATWTSRFNTVLFLRDFDATTKKAETTNYISFLRRANVNITNFEIIIKSAISYTVNIGSIFHAYKNGIGTGIDNFYNDITFFNGNNEQLQIVRLNQDTANVNRNYLYDLSTVITNVKRFDLKAQWLDIGGNATTQSLYYFYEFNCFTQNSEIRIPSDPTGSVFGFEYTAVEWWDFVGHFKNSLWWLFNESPIAPVFVWIDTYIVSYFVTFFQLIVDLVGL